MIKLSDICPGERCCRSDCGAACGGLDCCSCGLPWDATRGRHTQSGIRITEDTYCRILAREGEAIETEERREADREAIRAGRRLVIGGGR